jgi:DNA polymerase I-like protein with 3'-5' exonuclease and polymerase domains
MNNAYMLRIVKAARDAGIKCYPAMTVHDDNTYLVEENKIKEFVDIIHNVVATAFPDIIVKMDVEVKVGTTLTNCKEYSSITPA